MACELDFDSAAGCHAKRSLIGQRRLNFPDCSNQRMNVRFHSGETEQLEARAVKLHKSRPHGAGAAILIAVIGFETKTSDEVDGRGHVPSIEVLAGAGCRTGPQERIAPGKFDLAECPRSEYAREYQQAGQ